MKACEGSGWVFLGESTWNRELRINLSLMRNATELGSIFLESLFGFDVDRSKF